MLWRKLLMAGTSGPALSSHWIIPGGRIFGLSTDGDLLLMRPEDGWPASTDHGDPFVDAQRRVGVNVQRNLGGGVGEVLNVRLVRDVSEQAVRSLGPYRGWAGENVSAFMNSTGFGLGGSGHTFPNWTMTGGQSSFDTGHTAGWAWEQQDNGTSSGQSTISDFVRTIQDSYIEDMAYPSDVCATRNLAVVLRPVADTYFEEQHTDPVTNRRWLGWTVDAAGTKRRIRDLTPQQMRRIGHEQGFSPPDDVIVERSDQIYSWTFLRPLGPVGDDAILATGALSYSESYVRYPDADEWPYFLAGDVGYAEPGSADPEGARFRQSIPLTDQPLNIVLSSGYANDVMRRPVKISETRSSLIFVTVLITAAGIADLRVTGRTASRSSNVEVRDRTWYVMRRVGGGYDAFIDYPWSDTGQGAPEDDPYITHRYDGATFDTRFTAPSPNGWKVAIEVPQVKIGPGRWVDDGRYSPILVHADTPNGGAIPPAKPESWNDEEDGPWEVPPNDIAYGGLWRGLGYWNTALGRIQHQPANNFYTYPSGASGKLVAQSAYAPNGPYPRNGVAMGYVRTGTWVVAQHLAGGRTFDGHPVGGITPGLGATRETAVPSGADPTMRLFRWPGRRWAIGRSQQGAWKRSGDGGRSWTPMIDLGEVQGTVGVTADFERPEPPES